MSTVERRPAKVRGADVTLDGFESDVLPTPADQPQAGASMTELKPSHSWSGRSTCTSYIGTASESTASDAESPSLLTTPTLVTPPELEVTVTPRS